MSGEKGCGAALLPPPFKHSSARPYRENASSGFRATNSSNTCRRLFFCSLMFRFVLYPSRTAGQPASGVKVPNLCMNLAETGSHETQATEDKLFGHRGRKTRFPLTLGNAQTLSSRA